MAKDSLFDMAKADVKNTIASYFSPVKAVINEVSKAVAAETSAHRRATDARTERKAVYGLEQP